MSATYCTVCGTRVLTQRQTGRCWRHRARKALSPHRGGAGHRDPVSEAVAARVQARDRGCVGPRVGMPGACHGRQELDHIDNAGLSRRGPSTVGNLVVLCSLHHRWKTEHADTARPPLRAWVASHPETA